jgi:hypothetical protein
MEGRDSVWDHPDLMPTVDDLEDPEGFVHGKPGDIDLDLSKLNETEAPKPDDENPSGSAN